MRFIAVVLVTAIVIGGMYSLVIQQRAIQSLNDGTPAVLDPVAQTPIVAGASKPQEPASTSPSPAPQSTAAPGTPKPAAQPSPANPSPTAAEPTAPQPEAASTTRINETNYVQVSITPVSLRDKDGMVTFEVSLNTHSVDLSRYKLENQARLIIDGQSPITEGFQWVAKLDDSHHRSGFLKLPALDVQGKERINSATKTMVLEIDGVAGNDVRSFAWDSPTTLIP